MKAKSPTIQSLPKASDNEIEDLQEFVRLVMDLRSSRFGRTVLNQPKITLRMQGESGCAEIVNFDEEDCRAFLLGCRLLIQDNDRVSIRKVWKFFERLDDDKFFLRINPPRWRLNEYLDQETVFATPVGNTITNRILVDTFLHGSYAHLNRDHRKRFLEWQASPRQFYGLKLTFLLSLKVLLDSAANMAAVVTSFLITNSSGDPATQVSVTFEGDTMKMRVGDA